MEYENPYIRRGLVRIVIGLILLIACAVASEVYHRIHAQKVKAIQEQVNQPSPAGNWLT